MGSTGIKQTIAASLPPGIVKSDKNIGDSEVVWFDSNTSIWGCGMTLHLKQFWATPNPWYSQLTLIPQWERESDRVFLWSTNLSNNSSLVQRGLKGNERIAVCDSPTELNNVVPDLCDECLIYVRKQCLSLTLGLELCHWIGKLHSVALLCTVNCVKWLWSNVRNMWILG